MHTRFKFVSALVFALSVHSAAFAATPTAQDKENASNVHSACAQDAQTAGCSDQAMGRGFLKCLSNYKKANKSFQFTPDCRVAVEKFSSDRKASRQ